MTDETFIERLSAQAAERWTRSLQLLLGTETQQRRRWEGPEAILGALEQLITGMRGVQIVTPLHRVPSAADPRPETRGVETWGSFGVAADRTAHGLPVLRLNAPRDQTTWLAPSTLTYYPGKTPQDGVFALTAVHPREGLRTLGWSASDLLPAPGPASFPQWAAGGVLFAANDSRLVRAVRDAPPETWNNFDGLLAWALEVVATPPGDGDELGPDDPVVLATLRRALTRHREQTNRLGATRLDQGDFDAIGAAALDLGLNPTVRLVTAVARGGSPNVVNRLQQSFFARLKREGLLAGPSAAQPAVPHGLLTLYEQLRELARDAAELALGPTRDALKAREAELATRDDELHARAAALEEAERVAAAAREQMMAQIGDLQAQREQDREALATAQRMAQADASALAETRTELATARERAQRLTDEVARLATLVEEGKAREAALADEARRAGDEARDAQAQLTTLTERLKVADASERRTRDEYDAMRARWDDERKAHNATREALTADLRTLQGRLDVAEGARHEWGRRTADLEGQLNATARERERVEAEAQRLRDDVARLHVQLGLLSAKRGRSENLTGGPRSPVPKKKGDTP